MIRLYKRDFNKLKHGQLLWFVSKYDNGSVDIQPCKYLGKVKCYGYDHYDFFFYLYNNNFVYDISYIAKPGKNYDDSISYFAKVTKREESDFIMEILITDEVI